MVRSLTLLILVGLLVVPASAAAAPGVVQDLPGCATNTLESNDDGSTEAVPLGFEAQLFDSTFDTLFVNNNGNVTIVEDLDRFTPFDFRETGRAMIAPFFADVDTTGGLGIVRYGETMVDGHHAFCVIWDDVGYFRAHGDKRNSFQLLIVEQLVGIDLVFNYDSITWETGDLSGGHNGLGGTSAVAGYAAGDGDAAHAVMLPGSFVNGGLLDSNAATSLAGHGTAGQPAGRYIFQVRQGASTGGRLTGTIIEPGGDPAVGALVQVCRNGGGCVTRITSSTGKYTASNQVPGTYTVTAFPGPGPAFASATAENVAVVEGVTTTENLQLGELPPPPPPGTTITSIGVTDDGLPIAYWDDSLTLVTQGCPGATASYELVLDGHVVRSGPMTEFPAGSGTYRALIAPLIPNTGDGIVRMHLDCPASTDEDVEFGIYIDPSGVVRDHAGRPVVDATVTLLRSADPDGPFFAVPDGSAVMSPANRTNPDLTGAGGRFGWDVVAGYYVVTASKAGCASAKTAVLTIPPPVTDLVLRLDCRPKSSPPPHGGTTTPPPPTLARLATIGTKVKLRKGRTLLVSIACAPIAKTACAGKITVSLGRKIIGRKRYRNVKPGKRARVKVTLSKRGRAKLKRGKKIKLKIVATVTGGATVKRTVTLAKR